MSETLREVAAIRRALQGHEDPSERHFRALDALVADNERLRAALREVLDLAGVAHNGDPWYAEHEGLDGEAILRRGAEALAAASEGATE